MSSEQSKHERKAGRYRRSVWSNNKYDRPQTLDDLTRESLAVLRSNPAIRRTMNPQAIDGFLQAYKRSVNPAKEQAPNPATQKG